MLIPHIFLPIPLTTPLSNLSKDRLIYEMYGNSIVVNKTTHFEREKELKQMLNVKNVRVGKVWRSKYETSKSTKRERTK